MMGGQGNPWIRARRIPPPQHTQQDQDQTSIGSLEFVHDTVAVFRGLPRTNA